MIIPNYLNNLYCEIAFGTDFTEIGLEILTNVNTVDSSYTDQYFTRYIVHKNNLSVNCIQKIPPEAGGTTSGGVLEFNANGETFLSINDSYMIDLSGIQQFDAKYYYDGLQFITNNT